MGFRLKPKTQTAVKASNQASNGCEGSRSESERSEGEPSEAENAAHPTKLESDKFGDEATRPKRWLD